MKILFSDNPSCSRKKENDREIGFHFFLLPLSTLPYFSSAFSQFSLENGAAKYEFKSRNKYWRSIRWKKLPSWNYFMRKCYELCIGAPKIKFEPTKKSVERMNPMRVNKRRQNKNNGKYSERGKSLIKDNEEKRKRNWEYLFSKVFFFFYFSPRI